MLFNSQIFLLGFLPLSLLGYAVFGRRESSRVWYLIVISAAFYAYWEPAYTALILGSILLNWTLAMRYCGRHQRAMLVVAIAANLALLGLFKYLGFFATAGNELFGAHLPVLQWALPLGISFFTFHHIIYLADRLRGSTARYSLRDYALYILLFPQVLAGPLVRHTEIIHQFRRDPWQDDWAERWSRGLALLALGLIKKVFIADALTPVSDPVFAAAASGGMPGFLDAWSGILGFTFKIYFDFSGYSDMAIGIALLFGLTLPMNFDAPYIAGSLQDFWRRWHMTLSRFLRDYLYVPLGGNRKGPRRRYVNLMIVMLLGGLWHGAGWTFVVWGGLHGFYLLIAHAWSQMRAPRLHPVLGWVLTMSSVILAWTIFRANDLTSVADIFAGMAGLHGSHNIVPDHPDRIGVVIVSLVLIAFAAIAPNSQQIMRAYDPVIGRIDLPRHLLSRTIAWSPASRFAAGIAGLAVAFVVMLSWKTSEFLYFQF
ncbi:MAG TPA: MBOAT family O-acyltransferase [Alphaproteobacteria bacterium]